MAYSKQNKQKQRFVFLLLVIGLIFLASFVFYDPASALTFAHQRSVDGICDSCTPALFAFFEMLLLAISLFFFASSLFLYLFYEKLSSTIHSFYNGITSKKVFFVILFIGIFLRLLVLFSGLPYYAYDDHTEEILFIAEQNSVPLASDCWECFHPPFYYLIVAPLYSVASPFIGDIGVWFLLGIFSLGLSVGSLLLIWKSLCLLFSSPTYKLIGFAFAAFLPRSIYMSGTLSNDTLSYFFLTLLYYLLLLYFTKNRERFLWGAILVSLLCLQTKLSMLWVPCLLFMLIILFEKNIRRKIGIGALYVLLVIATIGPFLFVNHLNYGSIFVSPEHFFPYEAKQYYVGIESFASFEFFSLLTHPILHPATQTSFFSVLFADSWYDHTGLLVVTHAANHIFSPFLFAFGLLFSVVILFGIVRGFIDIDKKKFVLITGFLINILFLAVYFALSGIYSPKASYLLGSIVSMAFLFAYGLQEFVCFLRKKLNNGRNIERILLFVLVLFCVLVTLHTITLFALSLLS